MTEGIVIVDEFRGSVIGSCELDNFYVDLIHINNLLDIYKYLTVNSIIIVVLANLNSL